MATVDLSDWCKKLAPNKIQSVVKKIVFELDRGVVTMSPVDTGRFRANWQVSINAQSEDTLDAFDKSGAGAISKGLAVLGGYKLGDTIYILNNLPYAERLEDGWSGQAPIGMVSVTVARLNEFVRTATGGT